MSARIDAKTAQIESYCSELKQIIPEDFEEYEKNFEKRAACERYFEKIVEALVDLAYLVIKDAGLKMPEDDKEAFGILRKSNIISANLEGRLKDAKGMRNIIAHEYGGIDDKLVFHALTDEILDDAQEFVERIQNRKK
ncbi:DUF86 domain-containing protein [Candidatus Micrarchaeota archaeon]|nr:DUF86 domain-containing protein [Candidatus Micrarchaeota archaeon]